MAVIAARSNELDRQLSAFTGDRTGCLPPGGVFDALFGPRRALFGPVSRSGEPADDDEADEGAREEWTLPLPELSYNALTDGPSSMNLVVS